MIDGRNRDSISFSLRSDFLSIVARYRQFVDQHSRYFDEEA
jgi:uncharacterized protein YacL (UPF0231 family)